MKKNLLLLFTFLSVHFLYSQHLTFKVQDAKTQKAVRAVKVSSREEHTFLTFSSDSGYFRLNLAHDDTLKIEKADYHPIYITVRHTNFDTSHVIVINLVPVQKDTAIAQNSSDIKSLEYHFLHDNIEGSKLKVHVFDGYEASNTKNNQGTEFKFATVPLGHVHVVHKSEIHDENLYKPVKQ